MVIDWYPEYLTHQLNILLLLVNLELLQGGLQC